MDARSLIRPVVEGAGSELVDVSYGRENGRQVLRVIVDRPEGLDIETLADLSEKVSRRLDLEDFGRGRYELEVSTPGIERPLTTAAHFQRFVGTQVQVKTATPVDGARGHTGVIVAAGDDHVVLEVDGAEREIALGDITSARTVVDWDAELKRSRA